MKTYKGKPGKTVYSTEPRTNPRKTIHLLHCKLYFVSCISGHHRTHVESWNHSANLMDFCYLIIIIILVREEVAALNIRNTCHINPVLIYEAVPVGADITGKKFSYILKSVNIDILDVSTS